MSIMATLETKRTILRPFEESDAADLYEYAKDPRVGPMAGWKPHENMEESLRVIQTVLSAPHTFAIVEKATGKVIGSAGFTGRRHGESTVDEIGYALSPDYWGRGIMPEVVAELLRFGFEELWLYSIWCGHYADNTRSRRVIEKSGFTFVFSERLSDEFSTDRQTCRYVYLCHDWERRKQRG